MRRPTGPSTRARSRAYSPQAKPSSAQTTASSRGRPPSSSAAASSSATASKTFISSDHKALEQLVEKAPAALARADALPIAFDEPLAFGARELRLDRNERQAGALGK